MRPKTSAACGNACDLTQAPAADAYSAISGCSWRLVDVANSSKVVGHEAAMAQARTKPPSAATQSREPSPARRKAQRQRPAPEQAATEALKDTSSASPCLQSMSNAIPMY